MELFDREDKRQSFAFYLTLFLLQFSESSASEGDYPFIIWVVGVYLNQYRT
jgi:hypothetical protein